MLRTTRNTWLMLDNIHLTCDEPNCTNGYSTELPDAVYAQSDDRLQSFYRTLEARGWSTNLQTKRAFCPTHSGYSTYLQQYAQVYPYRTQLQQQQALVKTSQVTASIPVKPTIGQGWTRGHNWSHRVCSGPSFGSSSSVLSLDSSHSTRLLPS